MTPRGMRLQDKEAGAPVSRSWKGEGVGLNEMGVVGEMGTQERKQRDSVTAVPVHAGMGGNISLPFPD